jgi:hypothetical protein
MSMMRDLWSLLEPAIIAVLVLLVLTAAMLLLIVLTPALIPLAVVAAIALAAWLLPPILRRWRTPGRPPPFQGGPHYPDDQWR